MLKDVFSQPSTKQLGSLIEETFEKVAGNSAIFLRFLCYHPFVFQISCRRNPVETSEDPK